MKRDVVFRIVNIFDRSFVSKKIGVFMISFTCSCGKKYQLPDRIGGREVRCNQCQQTLLVPKQSQDKPVVPMPDPPEQTEDTNAKPETVASAPDESSLLTVLSAGESKKSVMDEVDWDATPVPKRPAMPNAVVVERSSAPTARKGNRTAESSPSKSSAGILVSLSITAILSLVLGFLGGKWIVENRNAASSGAGTEYSKTRNLDGSGKIVPSPGHLTASNWSVVDQEPIPFVVKTSDSKAIRISLAGNPVENAKKDKNAVLDHLAATLDTDDASTKKVGPRHGKSYKIESESPETLRLVWPGSGYADLDGMKLKEFRFFLYLSDQANSGFEPKKPEGAEQVLEFSDFRLRLIAETGYIDFVPVDMKKLVLLAESSRRDWTSIRIPISGNDDWKRENHGLVGPLVVEKIELHVKPTGKGLTFWLDNLQIDE